jgi:hypothetical protein
MDNKQQLNDVHAMVELIKENVLERNTEVDKIDAKVNKIGNVVVAMSKRDNEFKDTLTKNANKVEQLTSVENDLKTISQTMADEVVAVTGVMGNNKEILDTMTSQVAELSELNKSLTDETKNLVTSHANTQMEHVSTLKTDISNMTEQLKSLDQTDALVMIEAKLKHLQDKTQETIDRTKQTEQTFLSALAGLTEQISRVDEKMNNCAETYETVRANGSQTETRLKAIEWTLNTINELAQESSGKTDAKTEEEVKPETPSNIRDDVKAEEE